MKDGAKTTPPETVEMTQFVKRGFMLVRRDALAPDDPDHPYNYLRVTYGVDPEDYGVPKPVPENCCYACGQRLPDEQ
jgi:hypothetical protein